MSLHGQVGFQMSVRVRIYAGHLWSCETVTQKVAVAIPYDE